MVRKIACGVFFGLCSLAAEASLIVNGSFEQGPAIGPSGAIVVPKLSGPTIPATAITGWNVTVPEVDYIQNGFVGLIAQDGTKLIDLTGGDDGFATIQQTLSLQAGMTYQLDFWIGGSDQFFDFGDEGDPGVSVGITGLGPMTFTGGQDSTNDWRLQSWMFEAVQEITTISFTGVKDNLCCYIGLDNVSLRKIPEPTSIALFGVGLAGVGFARRRKLIKAA